MKSASTSATAHTTGGNILRSIGMVQDITERKKAEKALS